MHDQARPLEKMCRVFIIVFRWIEPLVTRLGYEKMDRRLTPAATAELLPPDTVDPTKVFAETGFIADSCDANNATERSGAHCHASSVAVCFLLTRAHYYVVMQISCHNRVAIQGDILGGAAMGRIERTVPHRRRHQYER